MTDFSFIDKLVLSVEEKKPKLLEKSEGGKALGKQAAYMKAATHFNEAFEVILDLMRNGRQESVRISAANKIIDKVLPDLKATELDGDLRIQLQNVVRLPTKRPVDTPPKTSGGAGA